MTGFSGVINTFVQILCQVISVLFVLATVVFLWGIIKYIIARDSEEDIKSSRQYIIYGIFGLFVMVSMWGIVNIAVITFFGNSAGGGFNQCRFPGGGGGGGNNNNGPIASDGVCQCRTTGSGTSFYGPTYPLLSNGACIDSATGQQACGTCNVGGLCTYVPEAF